MKNAAAVAESTSAEATGNPVDAIANLLTGDEAEDKDEETEDSKGEETQAGESTESDESDEAGEETEEESEEKSEDDAEEETADGDATWGDVLGINEDQLSFDDNGNVLGVKTKVNGEESVVPMGDLVAGYQLNKNVTQKSQALSEEKKVFEQQKEAVAMDYNQKLGEVVQLTEYLEQQLVAEYQGIDWDALRTQNPGEHAALKQEYAVRAQAMQKIRESNRMNQEKTQKETNDKQMAQTNAFVKDQVGKMIENNPTWADEKVFEKDMGALRQFCSNQYGFTDADFGLVRDSRLIELVKDASKYNAGVKLASKKIQKVVPKFQKSNGGGRKKVSKLESLTKQAREATGANKRDLQTDAIATLLSGG